MKTRELIKKHNSDHDTDVLLERFGLCGGEQVEIIIDEENLKVWYWSDNSDTGTGFLREDLGGWLSICIDGSREDQLSLAAQAADYNLRLLSDYLTDAQLALAEEDAKANKWWHEEDEDPAEMIMLCR
jgi:hypothetical protein